MATVKFRHSDDGLTALIQHRNRNGMLRTRPYTVKTEQTKHGGWLCWFGIQGYVWRFGTDYVSFLVRRSALGVWGCSCTENDCCHVGAAKRIYIREGVKHA